MTKTISFSIVIPLYNKEKTIERALRSALNQTVQDFEIIVVNDGSSDNGPRIVKAIDDPRIRLIHQENQGVSAARDRGIEEAENDFIALLDADDEWLPTFLETIRRLVINHPDCALYATRYFLKSPSGSKKPALVRGLEEDFEGILQNYFKVAVSGEPPVCSSATCARKNALLDIGGFPVGVKSGEDLLTWARLAVRFQVAYSMYCLAIFNLTAAHTYEAVPSRVPADIDIVGKGLAALLDNIRDDSKRYFRAYSAHWHKMRASSCLRLNMKKKARTEIVKALNYSFSLKLMAYLILSFCPLSMVRKVFCVGAANH